MTRKVLAILAACFILVPAHAEEMHPYAAPLPFGDYVEDVNTIIEGAFRNHGWRFTARAEGNGYDASISLKGFEIAVTVTVNDDNLVVDVESARMTECGGNCADLRREAHVERWVANLRRTIALGITQEVRDSLSGADG